MWHKAGLAEAAPHVRYWVHSGQQLLKESFSAFDPKRKSPARRPIRIVAPNPHLLVHEFALCHRKMVRPMMRTLNHDAHKAERFELRHLLGVGGGDSELDAVR